LLAASRGPSRGRGLAVRRWRDPRGDGGCARREG
jgi:hypothetical protein